MQRDSIDFGSMKVGQLFCKQLFPTLLGMVFSALFVITDGVFVGRGIGSDALAAVNIAAPLFVFAAGMGLMFGMGGAIVASINLAQGKERVANINATQATLVSFIGMTLVSILVMAFPTAFAMFQTALCVLTFFTRIDGPKIAMWCMTISTVINIVLDYLFIFVYKWGLTGAAVATGIGEIVGCILMVAYLLRYSPRVRLGKLKFSWKSIQLTARNSGYIIRLGFSAFLGEAAIGVMMLTGNYVFVSYLGTNGVAAFSIMCYFFPIIFMVFNAIIQSAQPIISFNHGYAAHGRAQQALQLALIATIATGLFFLILTILLREQIASLFIADHTNYAWKYAVYGIPFFSICYVFFGINITTIGYYMSIEKSRLATIFTVLRGIILPVICFFLLPLWLGVKGIWLAVAVAEFITFAVICINATCKRI